MRIWIITYNNPIYQGEYYTGEIVLEKGFLSKDAAEAWIDQQEYWWKYEAHELLVPVEETEFQE